MACKYIFSFMIILLISCSEIERDNILDPKNPESKRDRVLLLEAFVNTGNPLPYNDFALEAINDLVLDNDIKERLIVLEYHRDTQQYTDLLEADSFNTESIYNNYIDYEADRFKGVPDLFLNGAADRVQGASAVTNVVNRVKDIASRQLLEDSFYTLEVDFELIGNTIDGKYRVARLGNLSAEATVLRMMITYDSGAGKQTVSRLTNAIALASLNAGKYLEEDFVINNVPAAKAQRLVLVLWDNTGTNILHAIEREIL